MAPRIITPCRRERWGTIVGESPQRNWDGTADDLMDTRDMRRFFDSLLPRGFLDVEMHFDRTNVQWSDDDGRDEHRQMAARVFQRVGTPVGEKPQLNHVLLMGRKAINAFYPAAPYFSRTELWAADGIVRTNGVFVTFLPFKQFVDGVVVWTVPHPSGRCRLWNLPDVQYRFEEFINRFRREVLK